jgi:hypothetical protein
MDGFVEAGLVGKCRIEDAGISRKNVAFGAGHPNRFFWVGDVQISTQDPYSGGDEG